MPIYRKTDLGRAEIGTRQAGLSAVQRRLLILFDGQRDLATLREMLALADFDVQLSSLLALGLIEPVAGTSKPAAVKNIPRAVPPAPAAFPPGSESRVAEVLHMMVASSREYAGLHGEEIARLAQAAQNPELLRRCMVRWKLVLQESRGGAALAAEYFERAQAMLHDLAPA